MQELRVKVTSGLTGTLDPFQAVLGECADAPAGVDTVPQLLLGSVAGHVVEPHHFVVILHKVIAGLRLSTVGASAHHLLGAFVPHAVPDVTPAALVVDFQVALAWRLFFVPQNQPVYVTWLHNRGCILFFLIFYFSLQKNKETIPDFLKIVFICL